MRDGRAGRRSRRLTVARTIAVAFAGAAYAIPAIDTDEHAGRATRTRCRPLQPRAAVDANLLTVERIACGDALAAHATVRVTRVRRRAFATTRPIAFQTAAIGGPHRPAYARVFRRVDLRVASA